MRFASVFLGTLWFGLGCGGAAVESRPFHGAESRPPPPDSRSRGPAPEWVMRVASQKGRICAVGAVDPTFYRDDGILHAERAARDALARTVQVKITSVMYDYQKNDRMYVDQAVVEQVVGSISDVVLSGSEVESTWYDELGSVSRRGMTYALACMPTDRSAAEFAEKLKSVAQAAPESEKQIADVRERAKTAFEELEAQEAKAGETR